MTNHTTHMRTKGYLLLALACLSSAALAAPETFDFKDLLPHGMTCFETGFTGNDEGGDDEAGTCIAIGPAK